MLESLFNKISGLQTILNNAKFLRTPAWKNICKPLLVFLIIKLTISFGICGPLLYQKHNVGWFLLRRIVVLLRVCSFHIINRNHFCWWWVCRKRNLLYIAEGAICSDIRFLTVWTGFCLLVNFYLNTVQINRWLNLSGSFWGIPLRRDLFRKRKDQNNFLLQHKQLNCSSCWMVCKVLFYVFQRKFSNLKVTSTKRYTRAYFKIDFW